MALSLADIRARLQAQQTRSESGGKMDSAIYPHWNIPMGTTAKLRLLPDADTNNPYFWIEREIIKLPFTSIKGQQVQRPFEVQVPCMEMWKATCPVLTEVRPWYKDESLKETANKYWKKRSYLFQGFVRENPLADDSNPENPIRRFIISSQIYNIIKSSLLDPELEELPTHYERGLDFTVVKTTKSGTDYADYNTSKWSRKETALNSAELAALEQYGLFNLADFLPKRPGPAELKAIEELFHASVNGDEYDPDRWAQYFKPTGVQLDESAGSARPHTPVSTTLAPAAVVPRSVAVHDEDEDVAEPTAPIKPAVKAEGQKAEDILAMIRNRQKQ